MESGRQFNPTKKTPLLSKKQRDYGSFPPQKIDPSLEGIIPKQNYGPAIAIIIVPGIGGSNISAPKSGSLVQTALMADDGFGADLKWTMVQEHLLSSMESVRDKLLRAGTWTPLSIPSNPTKEEARGWHQVASTIYHPFMKHCQNKTDLSFVPEVFAIGYNFRNSNGVSADTVITQTKQIMDSNSHFGGYIYVTHSMGALPVRAALKKMQGVNNLYQKCVGVIHVAAPNLGAAELYRRFLQGVKGDRLTSYILGNTGESFSMIACVMPSMCELLPVPSIWQESFPDGGINQPKFPHITEVVKQVLQGSKYLQDNLDHLNQNFKNAQIFHKELGEFIHPNTAALILQGVQTTEKLKYKGRKDAKPNGVMEFDIELGDGDGTVTVKSQAAYAEVKEYISGIEHADPLTEKGKLTVFPAIYKLMESLIKNFSTAQSYSLSTVFPRLEAGFNYSLSAQPILLNGMKVIFDQPVGVYPVNLESKHEARRNGT